MISCRSFMTNYAVWPGGICERRILGTPFRQQPWFTNFMVKLLDNDKPVLSLLKSNPFPDHPPKYVRAMMYDYEFSDAAARAATGAWWVRKPIGLLMQPVSIQQTKSPIEDSFRL